MKRIFDLSMALILTILLLPLMGVIALAIKCTSSGPILYWSDRVGKNNLLFKMPKFRTMRENTPQLPTHLMTEPQHYLISIGPFLRKTSLDEIPQIWSILKGDMSFVGPRPALFNQDDLIALRTQWGIHTLVPGVTGWAQINGRDTLPIPEKVLWDKAYFEKKSFFFDLAIIAKTCCKILFEKDVSH